MKERIKKYFRRLWLKTFGGGIPVYLIILPRRTINWEALMKVDKGPWRHIQITLPELLTGNGTIEDRLMERVVPDQIRRSAKKWTYEVDVSKHYIELIKNRKQIKKIVAELIERNGTYGLA